MSLLGHEIQKDGIFPLLEKVNAIEDCPQPDMLKKQRELLGLINIYRQFVPSCASTLHPYTEMLTKRQAQVATFNWTTTATDVYHKVKTNIASYTMLTLPQEGAPTSNMMDSS